MAQSNTQSLRQRLEQLERNQRHLRRFALVVVALGVMGLVGWAPFDELPKIPTDSPSTDRHGSDLDIPSQPKADPSNSGVTEGDQPYNPSRLEWLSLKANATLAKNAWETDGFAIYFASKGRGSNTIAILANYDSRRVNRDELNKEIEFSRSMLDAFSKQLGWDGWLKIVQESKSSG